MCNAPYLENILNNVDICAVQEHWLYSDSLAFLNSIHQDFCAYGRSSNDLNPYSVWRRGKGGVAILWRKSLSYQIEILDDIGNDRIICIRVNLSMSQHIYIVCVYMPSSNVSLSNFKSHMERLEDVINQLFYRGKVVVMGDFNAHIGCHGGPRSFNRLNDKGRLLVDAMIRLNLISVNSQEFAEGPTETFFANDGLCLTTVDHILLHPESIHLVTSCKVGTDHCKNLSYHLPIYCKLNVPVEQCHPKKCTRTQVAWKCINNSKILQRYQSAIKRNLLENVGENYDIANLDEVESMLTKITDSLNSSAKKAVPLCKFKPHLKPYWKDGLDSLHQSSRLQRKIWIANGRPRDPNNVYYNNYKIAKRDFRKLLRRKAYEEEVRDFSDLTNAYDVNRSTFQKIMSKRRKEHGNAQKRLKVDDRIVTDEVELLDIWKNHYADLFTPKLNPSFNEEFKRFVEQKIQQYNVESFHCTDDPLDDPFEVEHVASVCRKLPNGKAGGSDGLVYEHLKYADNSLYLILTDIFNAIRNFEDVPECSTSGIIMSLFKGKKKSRLLKCNYREITLLNIIGKVFERLVLDRLMPKFCEVGIPHPLQFAYQKGTGCIQASYVLQKAALYNIERGSKVYACLLDSAKAFDTVWIDGLFYKLYQIGIRGKTWRILRSWYSKLFARVIFNDLVSDPFPVKQGVRQGGVLSPWLYLCFNNDIVAEPALINNGITVQDISVGCVMAADDIALLSCRTTGLQSMLHAMEEYSKKWRFEFNSEKSVVITLGESTRTNNVLKQQRVWTINGEAIKEKVSEVHVGILLSGTFSNKERCMLAATKGKEVTSCLLSSGVRPGGLNPICGVDLWRTVGISRMLYGCELWWDMTQSDLLSLEVANRFAAKRIQGLPPSTRSEAATGSLGLWTIEGYIDKAKLLFLHRLLSAPSESIQKLLFINRLFSYLYEAAKKPLGFVSDVIGVLRKYDLYNFLEEYLEYGNIPNAKVWKKLIIHKISSRQMVIWKHGVGHKKELEHYGTIHTFLQPLELWNVAKRNPYFINAITNTVNILCGNIPDVFVKATIDDGECYTCKLCKYNFCEIGMHFITQCPISATRREEMLAQVMDSVDVHHCAELFNLGDLDFYRALLGGTLSSFKSSDTYHIDNFVIIVSVGILKIVREIHAALNEVPTV